MDNEPPKPKNYITYFFSDKMSEILINFLITSKESGRISMTYNQVNIIKIYRQIVEKFLDINTPMKPFENEMNDKLLHIVLKGLCWLLIYDMIPEQLLSEGEFDFFEPHRSTCENFSMNFSQIDKKILNSVNVYSGMFMGLWSIIASASIFSFLLSIFPDSEISNNIEFVIQIEKYINSTLIGIEPQNMKEYHKSVLGLVIKEVRKDFPTYIQVKEPEIETQSFNSKSLIDQASETKEGKIFIPKNNNKASPRRHPKHDRSGLPIAQASEVYTKADNIMSDYIVDRKKQLFQICAQEEFYVESKEVPPITPLGITFEDFPKPHLPLDYVNPRDPRRKVIKRVRTFSQPKGAPKRRYRIIPEPDVTIAKIQQMNDYLTDNQIFML